MDIEEKLDGLNFKVKAKSYNPLECMDFKHLVLKAAEKNIASALHAFPDEPPWKCFGDLRKALLEIDAWLKFKSNEG
jgi:hypothetical protein